MLEGRIKAEKQAGKSYLLGDDWGGEVGGRRKVSNHP